ncbi:MAG: hypothetical protein ACO1OQ_01385 [Rufibacter sp.]
MTPSAKAEKKKASWGELALMGGIVLALFSGKQAGNAFIFFQRNRFTVYLT